MNNLTYSRKTYSAGFFSENPYKKKQYESTYYHLTSKYTIFQSKFLSNALEFDIRITLQSIGITYSPKLLLHKGLSTEINIPGPKRNIERRDSAVCQQSV